MSAEYNPSAANELGDYVRVLRRRWRVIAAITGIALVLAVVYSFSRSQNYVSQAKIQIPGSSVTTAANGSAQVAADVATETAVLKSQPVAERAGKLLKTHMTTDQLLAHVTVASPTDARVLIVQYTNGTAPGAQRGAQAFADAYLAQKSDRASQDTAKQVASYQSSIDTYQSQLNKAQADYQAAATEAQRSAAQNRINSANNLMAQAVARQNEVKTSAVTPGSILQSAELPSRPKGPGLLVLAPVGLVLGLGLGIVVAFVRERLDEQVREPSDIQEVLDVPVLGSIPRFPERFRSPATALVTVHAPEGGQADSFRRLRAGLLIALRQHQTQVLAVTSPSSGDGKSTIAANLAVTLAQSGRSVVLISADVRRPSLEQLFELEADHPGLLDVLGGTATFDEAVVSVGRFPVMASGRLHTNPTDLLQSVAMEKLVADARSRFDLVIMDTPPVLAVADVLGMVAMIDGVVLVVSVDQTSEAEVAQARTELDQAGASILGAVINRSAETTARYEAYQREY